MPRKRQNPQVAAGVANAGPIQHESHINGEAVQDYPLTSTSCLYMAAMGVVADTPIARSGANLKRSREQDTIADDWVEVRWDSSVEAFELKAAEDDLFWVSHVPTTNGIRSGTKLAVDGTVGDKITSGGSLLVKVGGNPNGSIFVCGTAAEVEIGYVAYGESGEKGKAGSGLIGHERNTTNPA
jgi:hypothetical protein